jgi:hypothetical protein
MSLFEEKLCCQDVTGLLVFYVCDEVTEKEQRQIEFHLADCKSCSEYLAQERKFQDVITNTSQSADEIDAAGVLLAQCRSELAESLDDLSSPPVIEHWQPFGWARRWMALRPAWSAALLLAFGALVGTQAIPYLQSDKRDAGSSATTVNVRAKPAITKEQLSHMVFGGISFAPNSGSGAPNVQLQLNAEQPMVISGSPDDRDVREVLTYVIGNADRYDAGVRLDCLEVLKASARNEQVRSALLGVARNDQNAAVRMEALEALRGAADQDEVRDALLEALQEDSNPGVRVRAVDLLVGTLKHNAGDFPVIAPEAPARVSSLPAVAPTVTPLADESVERVIQVLEKLQKGDSNRYVRLRSAAALRQIGPRESH